MDLKDLLETRPDDLAARQEKGLREYAAAKLKAIADSLLKGDYAGVEAMLEDSPSGDDHGQENRFVSFSELGLRRDSTDIGDVVDKLTQLQKVQK